MALFCVLFLVLTTGAGEKEKENENEVATIVDDDEVRRGKVRRMLRVLAAVPAALVVFLAGVVICFVRDPMIVKELRFGPSKVSLIGITWEDWKIGFFRAAIPQIPLSVLNSVIAVCKLSGDLFPGKEASAMKVRKITKTIFL